MKSLLALGILFFALSFCGIMDKIKDSAGDTAKTADPIAKPATDSNNDDATKTDANDGGEAVEKPNPSAKQQEIIDNGKRIVWEDQGMGWVLPAGWNKMTVSKKMFN